MGAVVCRPLRQQAAGAAQHPYTYPKQDSLRGIEAGEGRIAKEAAPGRLQGHHLSVQGGSRSVLTPLRGARIVANKAVTVPSRRRTTVALGDRRRRLHAWQDRIRDPSPTA